MRIASPGTRHRHRTAQALIVPLILYPRIGRICPESYACMASDGIAISVAIIGLVTAMIYLSKVQC